MTAAQRWISLDCPDQWRSALNGIAHAFGHTWESCRALQADSGRPTFLYSLATDDGRFVCPIEERVFDGVTDIVTPYGFSGFVGVGDSRGVEACWNNAAGGRGYVCGYLVNNPALQNRAKFPDDTLHKNIYVLDLTRSSGDLFHHMSLTLKRWEATAERIVTDKCRVTDFLLDNCHEFFARRNASSTHGLSRESLPLLADTDQVLMAGIEESGELTAASMFGYTSHSSDYLFNVSTPQGRGHSTALIWWAVERLRSMDVPHLNLGAGLVEGDGIARFKARFGAAKMPVPVVKQIYDRHAYVELCHRAGTDPDDFSGYFPAYRSFPIASRHGSP